jgi:hypothetical protein
LYGLCTIMSPCLPGRSAYPSAPAMMAVTMMDVIISVRPDSLWIDFSTLATDESSRIGAYL